MTSLSETLFWTIITATSITIFYLTHREKINRTLYHWSLILQKGAEINAYHELYIWGGISMKELLEKMNEIEERYDRLNRTNR